MDLKALIRTVPDYPKKGIMFRDITTLISHPEGLQFVIEQFERYYSNKNITKIVGIESRGFIIGGALAKSLHCGFIPIRKPGKLPYKTYSQSYELEYGTDTVEMHQDALTASDRVVIHDDLLATGGTINAAAELVKRSNATIVGLSFIIELAFLQPRKKLQGMDIYSLVQYDSE